MRTCEKVLDCNRPYDKAGFCSMHYYRNLRGMALDTPHVSERWLVRKVVDGVELKECNTCEIWQPLSDFHNPSTHNKCKNCVRAYAKAQRLKNKNQAKIAIAQKTCQRCKVSKDKEDYYIDESTKDGVSSRCRSCIGEERIIYYLNNQPKVKLNRYRRRERLVVAMTAQDIKDTKSHLDRIRNDDCFYCGQITPTMHYDHVEPLAKGGTNHWWNLVRACQPCNSSKSDKLIVDFIPQDSGLIMCEI